MKDKRIRIKQINQQVSQIILNDEDLTKNVQQKSKKQILKKKKEDNLQAYSIIAAIFFICFALFVYIIIMLHISSQNKQNKSIDIESLKNKRALDLVAVHKKFQKKQTKRIDTFNATEIEVYKERLKKSSAEITVQKLNRAKQFLKNLTEPINPYYFKEQQQMFQRDYNISKYDQKPICIVIPTYNNVVENRYKKNIDSILKQQYKNYRVIIIDDASSDNTSEAIENHIKNNQVYLQGRIKIQRNQNRKMALHNILDAAYNFCKPEQIFMVIDGDDYLLGKLVFKLLNYGFSDLNNWVVYSNFLTITDKVGYSRRYPQQIIQKNLFRNVLFVISHLRAFYTKLLLLIDKQDLMDANGNLFHAANDVAIFMPILQMARHHLLYLKQISYFYNSNTGMNNHQQKKNQQIKNDIYVRRKPRYNQLQTLFESSSN